MQYQGVQDLSDQKRDRAIHYRSLPCGQVPQGLVRFNANPETAIATNTSTIPLPNHRHPQLTKQ